VSTVSIPITRSRGTPRAGIRTTRASQPRSRERASVVEQLPRRHDLLPLGDRRILDIGCRNGDELVGFIAYGARADRLEGIDLLPERTTVARARHPDIRIDRANGDPLPFAAATFDIIVVSTVLSSILDRAVARAIAAEAVACSGLAGPSSGTTCAYPIRGSMRCVPSDGRTSRNCFPISRSTCAP
jgi:SAM-dependent methyltransferase